MVFSRASRLCIVAALAAAASSAPSDAGPVLGQIDVTAVLSGVSNWTSTTQAGLASALAWAANQAAPPNTKTKLAADDVYFNATVFIANSAITLMGTWSCLARPVGWRRRPTRRLFMGC